MSLLIPCLKISRICHQSIVIHSWCGRREAGNALPSWMRALNFAAISLSMMGSAIFKTMNNANLYCGVNPLKKIQYLKVCFVFVSHYVITWEKQSSYLCIKRMCGGATMQWRKKQVNVFESRVCLCSALCWQCNIVNHSSLHSCTTWPR